MQTTTEPSLPAMENIQAILGRFESWNGAETNLRSAQLKGVREISYEEALDKDRRRLRPVTTRTQSPSRSSTLVATHANIQSEPHNNQKRRKLTRKPTGENRSAEPANSPVQKTKRITNSCEHHGSACKQHRKSRPIQAARFKDNLAQFIDRSPRQVSKAAPNAAPPDDRYVAKFETKSGRTLMQSVRLSASEQVIIRARAEQAGLSTSAYMRQCALEIEELRRQVELSFAQMKEQRITKAAQASALNEAGLFARTIRMLLRRASAVVLSYDRRTA